MKSIGEINFIIFIQFTVIQAYFTAVKFNFSVIFGWYLWHQPDVSLVEIQHHVWQSCCILIWAHIKWLFIQKLLALTLVNIRELSLYISLICTNAKFVKFSCTPNILDSGSFSPLGEPCFLSPPVLMHDGLLSIAFCPSVGLSVHPCQIPEKKSLEKIHISGTVWLMFNWCD